MGRRYSDKDDSSNNDHDSDHNLPQQQQRKPRTMLEYDRKQLSMTTADVDDDRSNATAMMNHSWDGTSTVGTGRNNFRRTKSGSRDILQRYHSDEGLMVTLQQSSSSSRRAQHAQQSKLRKSIFHHNKSTIQHHSHHRDRNHKGSPIMKLVVCLSSLLLGCLVMFHLSYEHSSRELQLLIQQQQQEQIKGHDVQHLRHSQQLPEPNILNQLPIRKDENNTLQNSIQSIPKSTTQEEKSEELKQYQENHDTSVNDLTNSIDIRKAIIIEGPQKDKFESLPENQGAPIPVDEQTQKELQDTKIIVLTDSNKIEDTFIGPSSPLQQLEQSQESKDNINLRKDSANPNNDNNENDNIVGPALVMGPIPVDSDTVVKLDNTALTVPDQFRSDIEYFMSNNDPKRNVFPRWDLQNPITVSVFDTILDFTKAVIRRYEEIGPNIDYSDHFGMPHTLVRTSDHHEDVIWWLPETLYIVSANDGIYVSSKSKKIHLPIETRKKIEPTEQLMKLALPVLKNEHEQQISSSQRWSRLRQLLFNKQNDKYGSFPFLAWYGDYTGCNAGNWNNGTASVLLFTVAGNVNCNNTFPFPNFQTYRDSLPTRSEWITVQEQYKRTYPIWEEKIPKVVWRGSLTGRLPKNENERCPRYHLTKLVHSSELLTEQQRNLFDVKLTSLPTYFRRGNIRVEDINVTMLGGLSEGQEIRMEDFQKYRAVLDVDGQSWSSRFGKLLCYNSVVLKVDPQYVDYFFYGRESKPTNIDSSASITTDDTSQRLLQPWKHYIPIKSDLTDLVEKTRYAVADENKAHVAKIISNANQWCTDHMTHNQLAVDVLDTWETYVNILDKSSPAWKEQWDGTKHEILGGTLLMQSI